jgi:hypothetical protein
MRHTDIRLTTKVYVDPQHLRLVDALKKLPTISPDVSTSVSANPDEDVPTRPNLAQPRDAEE